MSGALIRSKSPLARGATLSAAKPAAASVPAALKPEAHAQPDGYIPFKIRFQAWWEGVEPEALVRKGQKSRAAPQRSIALDAREDLPPDTNWSAARVRICDQVWGEGFTGPGGAEYGLEHIGPFPQAGECKLLDMSAGLGGRIAVIAQNPDIVISGLERDAEFADHAQERAARLAQDNVLPIVHYNPDRLDLHGGKFDAIVAREVFCGVAEKLALLGALRRGVRNGGVLAFTDLVLAEFDQNEGPVMENWARTEPVRPQPWSMDEYRDRLEALNFDIVNFEDDSDRYRDLVVTAWKRLANGLESEGLDRAFVDALITEAELWLHRMRALESGQLRLLKVTVRNKYGE